MKNAVGFGLLVLAVIFGLLGAWTAMELAPWAFVGAGPPDYGFAVLCYSPLAVAFLLLGASLFTLLQACPGSRAKSAQEEVIRLKAELETLRRDHNGDAPAN
jgi:hypothetical protein